MGRFDLALSKIFDEEEIKIAFDYLSMDSYMRKNVLRRIAKSLASPLVEKDIAGCEDIVGSKVMEALRRYEDMITKIEKGIVKDNDVVSLIRWHTTFSGPEYLMMVNLIAFSFILRDRDGIKQVLKAMADGRKDRIEVLKRIARKVRLS